MALTLLGLNQGIGDQLLLAYESTFGESSAPLPAPGCVASPLGE